MRASSNDASGDDAVERSVKLDVECERHGPSLGSLNQDILEVIFKAGRYSAVELAHLRAVCHTWHSVIMTRPYLWKDLWVSIHTLHLDKMDTLFKQVQNLELRRFHFPATDQRSFKNSMTFFKLKLFIALLSDNNLLGMVEGLLFEDKPCSLEFCNFLKFPNLKYLHFCRSCATCVAGPGSLLGVLSALKATKVRHVVWPDHIDNKAFAGHYDKFFAQYLAEGSPASLESLDVRVMGPSSGYIFQDIRLRKLGVRMDKTYDLSPREVNGSNYLFSSPVLQTLVLTIAPNAGGLASYPLTIHLDNITKLPKLTELVVGWCGHVSSWDSSSSACNEKRLGSQQYVGNQHHLSVRFMGCLQDLRRFISQVTVYTWTPAGSCDLIEFHYNTCLSQVQLNRVAPDKDLERFGFRPVKCNIMYPDIPPSAATWRGSNAAPSTYF